MYFGKIIFLCTEYVINICIMYHVLISDVSIEEKSLQYIHFYESYIYVNNRMG